MKAPTVQEVIRRLNTFWSEQGCVIQQGYDLEVGAGTFNPATFLRSLGPEPFEVAFAEPCRRPTDGRYGENPNRFQHYFQYQVIMKPSPLDLQERYLRSLEAIGIDLSKHDIRFVHDDWESPTLGAWGLGWEVWCDGMEVTQYTYFQSVAGVACKPVSGELTYGVERLCMYLQNVDNGFDLQWNDRLTYGDIFKRNEFEFSSYNFDHADAKMWLRHFEDYEREAKRLFEAGLPLPGYDFVMKASHAFNLLDARGVISVTERTGYIQRIRDLACLAAEGYLAMREEQGFPLLDRWQSEPHPDPQNQPPAGEISVDPAQRDDFVLEIGSEELPAEFVPIGCRNLESDLRALLDSMDVEYQDVHVMGTPRRLTAYVTGLARGIVPKTVERRGPAVAAAFDADGNVAKAGEGFFRSLGMDAPSLADIEAGKFPELCLKEVKGKAYLFAQVTKSEFATETWANLQRHLPKLILGIDFPKKMRWSDLEISYARPLRWLLAIHGKDVIPFHVGPLASGSTSRGHRQMQDGEVTVSSANDYRDALRDAKVMVDIAERRACIEKQLDELESSLGAKAAERNKVIAQVLHLTEWPLITDAPFDESFLRVPKEVLISEMVEHQKYFPLVQGDGSLMNRFVITADCTPTDEIRHGNQKVLSARLSDGVFLYEQDLEVPLADFNEKLKNVIYQKKLGSVFDKVQRLGEHTRILYDSFRQHNAGVELVNFSKVARAAELCKADLASDMVGEFPELQGVIGRYYAEAHGEDQGVAQAIEEHWMPRGEKDDLPASQAGAFVSLAEKLDNILGCFLVCLKPKSSSDPYGLRRQVLAIVRILIERKWNLPLRELMSQCLKVFPEEQQGNTAEALKDVEAFIINRIKTVFLAYGVEKDEIEASLASGFDDIYDSYCKVQALHRVRESDPRFPALYEVFKRARGQLEGQADETFRVEALVEDAEKALHTTLQEVTGKFDQAIDAKDYDKAYLLIAELQPGLATLFDEVRILADDENLKKNRVALLQQVFALFNRLLDLSKLQASAKAMA